MLYFRDTDNINSLHLRTLHEKSRNDGFMHRKTSHTGLNTGIKELTENVEFDNLGSLDQLTFFCWLVENRLVFKSRIRNKNPSFSLYILQLQYAHSQKITPT